jgi:hypothetical protein
LSKHPSHRLRGIKLYLALEPDLSRER